MLNVMIVRIMSLFLLLRRDFCENCFSFPQTNKTIGIMQDKNTQIGFMFLNMTKSIVNVLHVSRVQASTPQSITQMRMWLSVLCLVCHVFPPLVSIFGLFPVLVSCDY